MVLLYPAIVALFGCVVSVSATPTPGLATRNCANPSASTYKFLLSEPAGTLPSYPGYYAYDMVMALGDTPGFEAVLTPQQNTLGRPMYFDSGDGSLTLTTGGCGASDQYWLGADPSSASLQWTNTVSDSDGVWYIGGDGHLGLQYNGANINQFVAEVLTDDGTYKLSLWTGGTLDSNFQMVVHLNACQGC